MSFKERYLRGDCSIDMINDYVEMWHGEGEIKKTLSEFLGLSQEEYVCWMISSDEELARMLSRSLPHRDLPYCARHIGWKELKEQLEQAVQTLLSPDYHIAVQPTNGSPLAAATDTACRYGVSAERADLQGAGAAQAG